MKKYVKVVQKQETAYGAPIKVRKFGFSRKQLCIPYALFLIMFVIIPLFVVVYYAFTGTDGSFTFNNFISFFSDRTKISTLLISILVSLLVTIICLLIAYPVAFILTKMNKQVAFVLLLLFTMPMWINFVLRAMAMKELLGLLGIPLGSFANIIGLTYDFLPFMIMPLYSTLVKLDKNLEEAASDLGANKAKVFLNVTLPLSVPGIISGAMMVFLPVMSCYVITDTFSGGSGFSLIGKLVAICFLGVGGAPVQINDGAALALVMLVIMVITMSVTGGFKNSENTRGTNL